MKLICLRATLYKRVQDLKNYYKAFSSIETANSQTASRLLAFNAANNGEVLWTEFWTGLKSVFKSSTRSLSH